MQNEIKYLANRVLLAYEMAGYSSSIIGQWALPYHDLDALLKEIIGRQPKKILEIGTYVGITTQLLALATEDDCRIYSIDPNLPLSIEMGSMKSNLDGIDSSKRTQDIAKYLSEVLKISDKIFYFQGGSTTGATFASEAGVPDVAIPVIGREICEKNGPFDVIFVDGLHYEEAVYKDLCLAAKYLQKDGLIITHDNKGRWAGNVRSATWRFLDEHADYSFSIYPYENTDCSLGFVWRRDGSGPKFRVLKDNVVSNGLWQPHVLENMMSFIRDRYMPKRIVLLYSDITPDTVLSFARNNSIASVKVDPASPVEHIARNIHSSDFCICIGVMECFLPDKLSELIIALCGAFDNMLVSMTPPGELGIYQKCTISPSSMVSRCNQNGFTVSLDIMKHIESWLYPGVHGVTAEITSSYGLFNFVASRADPFKDVSEKSIYNDLCIRIIDTISLHRINVNKDSVIAANTDTISKLSAIRDKHDLFLVISHPRLTSYVAMVIRWVDRCAFKNLLRIPSRIAEVVKSIFNSMRYANYNSYYKPYCAPLNNESQWFDDVRKDIVNRMDMSRYSGMVHHTSRLQAGGAEKQMACLAAGQKRLGYDVRVYCAYLSKKKDRHYASILDREQVPYCELNNSHVRQFKDAVERGEIETRYIKYIPPAIRREAFSLAGALLNKRPTVLHCWLDWPNCVGVWAGLMLKVPKIILSFRNVNPSHFEYLYNPWFKETYQAVISHPSVVLSSNSYKGAADYAHWLEIPKKSIKVVHNGIDFKNCANVTQDSLISLRRELGISGDKILLGVFRLSREKNPVDFIKVVSLVKKKIPELIALHAGIGDHAIHKEMISEINKLGLMDCVRLLGRRGDVPALMAASKALLLCSKEEGLPNVLLEASWYGCPCVSTDAGDADCIILHEKTGFIHSCGDIDAMAESIIKLLNDDDLRTKMNQAAKQHVLNNFDLDKYVKGSLELY